MPAACIHLEFRVVVDRTWVELSTFSKMKKSNETHAM